MKVLLKRVYDPYSENDGCRVLVDRLWPRGKKKEELKLDYWAKDIAPSSALRKWFDHDPLKWEGFKKRYIEELESIHKNICEITRNCKKETLTLLYSAKNRECNQAVVLKKYIEDRIL